MIICELSDAEWESLQELRSGPLKRKIPLPHQVKLVRLGLAKKLFDGVIVSAEGRRYQRSRFGKHAGGLNSHIDKPARSLRLVASNKDFPLQPTSS